MLCGMWDLCSLTRIEPWPPAMLQWKHGVLTTGQPGKSCYLIIQHCFVGSPRLIDILADSFFTPVYYSIAGIVHNLSIHTPNWWPFRLFSVFPNDKGYWCEHFRTHFLCVMNTCGWGCLQGTYPQRSGIARSQGMCTFSPSHYYQVFFSLVLPICSPSARAREFPFFHILLTTFANLMNRKWYLIINLYCSHSSPEIWTLINCTLCFLVLKLHWY